MGKVDCMRSQDVMQLSLAVFCNLPKHEKVLPSPLKCIGPLLELENLVR